MIAVDDQLTASPAQLDAALSSGDPTELTAALEAGGLGPEASLAAAAAVSDGIGRFEALVATASGLRPLRGFVGTDCSLLADDGDDRNVVLPVAIGSEVGALLHLVLGAAGFGERPDGEARLPRPPDVSWPAAAATGSWSGEDPAPELARLQVRAWWAIRTHVAVAPFSVAVLDAGDDGLYVQEGTTLRATKALDIWKQLAGGLIRPLTPADAAR